MVLSLLYKMIRFLSLESLEKTVSTAALTSREIYSLL